MTDASAHTAPRAWARLTPLSTLLTVGYRRLIGIEGMEDLV